MKARCLIALALALVACSSQTPDNGTLTIDQATQLARRLANEKAKEHYNCQPFHDGPLAQLVQEGWVWRDRRGQGQADIEARVKFERDGANPSVSVVLLDNRAVLRPTVR